MSIFGTNICSEYILRVRCKCSAGKTVISMLQKPISESLWSLKQQGVSKSLLSLDGGITFTFIPVPKHYLVVRYDCSSVEWKDQIYCLKMCLQFHLSIFHCLSSIESRWAIMVQLSLYFTSWFCSTEKRTLTVGDRLRSRDFMMFSYWPLLCVWQDP